MDNSLTNFSAQCNRVIDGYPCGIIHHGNTQEEAQTNANQCDHNPLTKGGQIVGTMHEFRMPIPYGSAAQSAEPKLLTLTQILNASLEVFADKLGPWPHLTFEVTKEEKMRVGSCILENGAQYQALNDTSDCKLHHSVITLAHQEPEWAYFCTVDLRLPLEEFTEKHLRIPMTNLAAVVRGYLHDYKRRVIFGKLMRPGGIQEADVVFTGNFAIRGIRSYDINIDRFPLRMDVLFGGI